VTNHSGATLTRTWRSKSAHSGGTGPDPARDRDFSAGAFALGLAIVVALAAVLYVSLGWSWAKFSRAEVFFAECAREMLRDGNFITPLFHGRPFFDKPIFIYWLIVGMFKTFGVSHLAARVPSILAAATSIAVTGAGTALLFGRRSGLLAAMAVASSFMFLGFSYLCMSDMTLVLFETMTISLLYAGAMSAPRRNQMWWLGSFTMGLAFLTKGPVGIVLPTVCFLVFLALTRQLSLIKPRHVLAGAATILVLSLPWWIAAYKANGTGALIYFFVRENLIRFAGSTYDTHKPIWFMLVSLMTGFAPWSPFLPLVLWSSVKKWRLASPWSSAASTAGPGTAAVRESRHDLYLWLWIAVVIGFFSLSRGKLDYYALPAFPAAAALVGLYLSRWIERDERPAVVGAWLLAGSFVSLATGAFLIQKTVHGLVSGQLLFTPIVMGAAGILMVIFLRQRRLFQVYATAFAGLCLSATTFALQIVPEIVRLVPTGHIVAVLSGMPADLRIGVHEALGSWVDEITFQTNREPVRLDSVQEIHEFLSDPRPSVVVASEDKVSTLLNSTTARVRVLDRRTGITHTLTPGYALKRKGQLLDEIPVVIVTNY